MRYRRSVANIIFDIGNHCFLIALCFVTLYPFYYVLVASLSDPSVVAQSRGILFWPEGLNFDAYRRVFANPIIGNAYTNTLIYVSAGTAINILLTSFAAYALSRKGLWGRRGIMLFIVFTMFFSGGLIPTYLLVRSLGLIDTRWALLLPSAINTFNFIVMRTAFAAIPESMEESAKIDGANDFTILFRIYLPLAFPVVAVMILFYAVQHWNSWFPALIYLRSRDLYPLQLILREILIASDVGSMTTDVLRSDAEPIGYTIKYATIIITMLPITVLYPFLQRYFVKGVLIGSLKE